MANQVVWVDIPVIDMDRALAFYGAVLGAELQSMEYETGKLGFLPGAQGDVSGCFYVSAENKPSDQGPMIYLNCEGRLDKAANAVEAAGGKIVLDVHQIGPHGYRAVILDSEGNKVALHSHAAPAA